MIWITQVYFLFNELMEWMSSVMMDGYFFLLLNLRSSCWIELVPAVTACIHSASAYALITPQIPGFILLRLKLALPFVQIYQNFSSSCTKLYRPSSKLECPGFLNVFKNVTFFQYINLKVYMQCVSICELFGSMVAYTINRFQLRTNVIDSCLKASQAWREEPCNKRSLYVIC